MKTILTAINDVMLNLQCKVTTDSNYPQKTSSFVSPSSASYTRVSFPMLVSYV